MTVNSLSPAFVRINYQSAFGPHTMTIPSVPVDDGLLVDADSGNWAFVLRGAELPVGVDGAINDFVNLIKVNFPTGVTFIDYVVYQQPAPEDAPYPVWSNTLAIVGTGGAGIWSKATQETWTFRADDFTTYKLVLLDYSAGSFDKITAISGIPSLEAIRAYIVAPETWIASRGGGRPNTFLQIAQTLNEKLRRAYRMN